MKRWKKLLAGLLAMAISLSGAPGYGSEVKAADISGDFEYEVSEDKDSVTITKYTGDDEKVEIPSDIDGKIVISIGDWAFSDCSSLTGITIPNSVASIGKGAFSGCIGLTGITIPDSVTSIGERAFYRCSGLKGIMLANSVTSIEGEAFSGCIGLTGITIPDSVTSIGSGAFSDCIGLTGITIPDSVTSIGWGAFSGCIGLTGITIPDSVTSIGWGAFSDCSSLEQIKVEEGNPKYDSRDGCNAIVEKESRELALGCQNTIIPDSVTSIGVEAFSGCIGLTGITIPDSVISIGEYAFSGCINLTEITIPDSVTSIRNSAFSGCSGLMGITIPNSVTSIADGVFDGCSGLTGITIPDSVTSIGSIAFYDCIGLTGITIPDSVTSIGWGAFSGCSGLEQIKVEEGNPKYDSRDGCNAIIERESRKLVLGCKNTVIPNSVTSIGEEAFSGCIGLTGITIPDSVTSIGEYAFNCCISLTGITIPDSVTSIGEYAFCGCSGLSGITIPGSVTSIGDQAVGWYWVGEVTGGIRAGETKRIPGFIIYGERASEAERYAKEDGFEFRLDPSQGGHAIDISKAVVTLSKTSYTYDGTAKTPSVTVELGGKRLSVNKDYTISYSNNVKVGTAKVMVTGKGSYTGSRTASFTIAKADITCKKNLYKVAYGAKPFKISASSSSRMSFTSSNPKVAAVGRDTGKVTVKNTGTVTITIKAGGASKKVTVKVSPKKQSVKSAKAVKGRKLTVKWAKDKRASGYQVQVSTSKNFKKGVKTKDVSKTSCTFTKLKTGKKYYIRIRSYKKSGKEKLYGTWSKTKQGGKVKK